MAFEYAYGNACEVKDFAIDDATVIKKGAPVKLTAGKVVLAANTDTAILGIYEGDNFRGITKGNKYEAVTVTENSQRDRLAKVRTGAEAIYRIPYTGAPVVGAKYGLSAWNDTATLDGANTTTGAIFTVVEIDAAKGVAFVQAPTVVK